MTHTESFVGVPATLNALYHKDYKSQYLETYIAIRSLISLSPDKDNFCFCFPSIETIAKKYNLIAEAVRASIAWLKSNGYLYTLPRGKRPITYTIVTQRERFIRAIQDEGLERAIEINEAWMKDQRDEARNKNKIPGSKA
jgi:hypothetical protein